MEFTAGVACAALLLASSASTASAHGSHQEASPVYSLPGPFGAPIEGASATIKRSNGGATVTFNSTGFGAHHAVTVWAISFSNPENCDCGGPPALPGRTPHAESTRSRRERYLTCVSLRNVSVSQQSPRSHRARWDP